MTDSDSLSVSCPSCSKKLIAPTKAIGKMARCTKCNCRFEVHDPTSPGRTFASEQKVTESKAVVSGDLSVETDGELDFQSAMELVLRKEISKSSRIVSNRLDLQQIRQAFRASWIRRGSRRPIDSTDTGCDCDGTAPLAVCCLCSLFCIRRLLLRR